MVRIYPTQIQKILFNKCIGANRYFYNKANDFVKKQFIVEKQKAIDERNELSNQTTGCVYKFLRGKHKDEFCGTTRVNGTHYCADHETHNILKIDYSFLNRQVIRDAVVTSDSLLQENCWEKEIPYDTRQLAIDQLTAAYKSNFELRKNRENKTFDMSFRKKKAGCEIFQIEKRALKLPSQKIFSKRLKKSFRVKKRDLDKLTDGFDGTVTCVKIKPGKWYLALPRSRSTMVPENDAMCSKKKPKETEPPIYESPAYKSVFIDPGARTFATFYSPDGICGKIGNGFAKTYLRPLRQRIELLESVRAKTRDIVRRRNLRNRLFKIRQKMKNIVKDFHNKASKFLCDGFDTIFFPKFHTSGMVGRPKENDKGSRRVISKTTVKDLMGLSFCKFREKLLFSAKTKQRKLFFVGEDYTTKTCGSCGNVRFVGRNEIYICNSCGYRMDRDYHGARNVCIKMLSTN